MPRGACGEVDPELFFPVGGRAGSAARQAEAAKAVCGRCVVRVNCLSYALETMPEGIWGGTSEEERRAVRGSWVRRANSRPGSAAGAVTAGEPAAGAAHGAGTIAPGRAA
jgi:WhiB family redox-sensing transcriptional regulator